MKAQARRAGASAVAISIILASRVAAVEIESTFSGGFHADGSYTPGHMNYYVGYTPSAPVERRNWFLFDLTGFTGTVVDAKVKLYLPGDPEAFEACGYISPDMSEPYVVTSSSVPWPAFVGAFTSPTPLPMAGAMIFPTLGTGPTVFGAAPISAAACGSDVILDVPDESLPVITDALGDHIVMGGRLADLLPMPGMPPSELLFAYTDIGPGHPELPFPRLELTLSDATPTPTPTDASTATATPTSTPTATSTPAPTPTVGCPPVPAGGCLLPGAAILDVVSRPLHPKDRLVWQWKKGPALSQPDFGDPLSSDDYSFCLYEDSTPKMTLDAPSGSAWSEIGSTGFKYVDGDADGLRVLRLVGGDAGKSTIVARARGASLALTTPPGAPIFTPGSTITVQVHGAGTCWGVSFSGSEVLRNTHDKVRAKK